MQTRDFKFELKNVSEDGTFEGYLSVFDVKDLVGDVVVKGAFAKTIQEHEGTFPMLWQHDAKQPIGTFKVFEDNYGLKVFGTLILEVRQAQEAYALLRASVVKGLSIGFETIQKKSENGIRYLKELRLFEGSIVTFPALPDALITSVKDAQILTEEFFENYSELKAGRAISAERAARLRSIMTEIQSLLDAAEPTATVVEPTAIEEPKGITAPEPDLHSLLNTLKNFQFTGAK